MTSAYSRANPALDPIRRTAKLLRELASDADGGKLTVADSEALPEVIESLGLALAEWLRDCYIEEQGASYDAKLQPANFDGLITAARALGIAGRYAGPD